MLKSFFGGVHPPGFKTSTKNKNIRPAALPKKIILPLSQHTGSSAEPVVSPGDYVEAGAVIAKATGFISSNIHSSVSGKVLAIEPAAHPVLGKCRAIIIEPELQQKRLDSIKDCADSGFDPGKLNPADILDAVSSAGIVGMGGAAFPAHVKLSPPKNKKIDTLIINAAECEPYLTCDHRLLLERPIDIINGIKILANVLGVKKCIVGIEDNKCDSVEVIRNASILKSDIKVVPLHTKYPQGSEKQLIDAMLDKEVPSGGLPFDAGVVVHNVATALAIYEAVALNKPLYERVVTVSGDCIKDPANLLVKIGTPASELAAECGGFIKKPKKIIFGGPMMGVAQPSEDAPVIKGTSGILFLSKDIAGEYNEGVCIRCGACVRACPMYLEPTTIYYAAKKARFDIVNDLCALDCIECGACSFDCPARLELSGIIKYAKAMIKK